MIKGEGDESIKRILECQGFRNYSLIVLEKFRQMSLSPGHSQPRKLNYLDIHESKHSNDSLCKTSSHY